MNNQNLIIYDFPVLFNILSEIKNNLNFKLLNVSKKEYDNIQFRSLENYLVITKKKS